LLADSSIFFTARCRSHGTDGVAADAIYCFVAIFIAASIDCIYLSLMLMFIVLLIFPSFFFADAVFDFPSLFMQEAAVRYMRVERCGVAARCA